MTTYNPTKTNYNGKHLTSLQKFIFSIKKINFLYFLEKWLFFRHFIIINRPHPLLDISPFSASTFSYFLIYPIGMNTFIIIGRSSRWLSPASVCVLTGHPTHNPLGPSVVILAMCPAQFNSITLVVLRSSAYVM